MYPIISQIQKHSKDAYSEIKEDIFSFIQHSFTQDKEFGWLIIALIIGTGIRGYFLSQPMRYDEAYTFLNFVLPKFSQLFYYPLPNNHVLHSILVQISTSIWGKNPVAIRLPALLSGIGIIPITFYLSRSLKQSGVLASIAIAVFPYFVLFSVNARGYTLLVFFTLGLAFTGIKIVRKRSISYIILFALLAALGMFTIPSMLFSIVSIYVWTSCLLLIEGDSLKNILYKFVFPSGLLMTAFTLIFYTPVIYVSHGIKSIIGNRFVEPQSWQSFLDQILPHFQQTFTAFSRNIPESVVLACATLVIIGIYGSIKKQNWAILLILPSMFFGSAIVFIAKHKIPFARTWIYLIPFVLLVADYGFSYIAEKTSKKIRLLMNVAVFVAGIIVAGSFISSYPDISTLSEPQIVAEYLKPIVTPNDSIRVLFPKTPQTQFYLWYYNVPGFNAKASVGKQYFIVYQNHYSITDMTEESVVLLFNFNDVFLYQNIDP